MEEIKFNKQQQFFLSEYCPQEINSREIYPYSTFSSKRNKIIINVPKSLHSVLNSWKSLEICQEFSRTGKSVVNGDKVKSVFVFVPKFESWEKLCSCFFKVSIGHLFW